MAGKVMVPAFKKWEKNTKFTILGLNLWKTETFYLNNCTKTRFDFLLPMVNENHISLIHWRRLFAVHYAHFPSENI